MPKFDPGATLDAIERERITLTVLVPAQLTAMMAHPRWNADRSVKPARASRPARRSSRRLSCKACTTAAYRSSRSMARPKPVPIAAYHAPRRRRAKGGSGRHAGAALRVRIVGDDGARLPPAVRTVRSSCAVQTSCTVTGMRRETTAEALREGWFVYRRHRPFRRRGLSVCGDAQEGHDHFRRREHLSGRDRKHPARKSRRSPKTAWSGGRDAPLGRDGRRGGRCSRRARDEAAGDVLALLEGRIARYKRPRLVRFVDALPRTALGKVQRRTDAAVAATATAAGTRFGDKG